MSLDLFAPRRWLRTPIPSVPLDRGCFDQLPRKTVICFITSRKRAGASIDTAEHQDSVVFSDLARFFVRSYLLCVFTSLLINVLGRLSRTGDAGLYTRQLAGLKETDCTFKRKHCYPTTATCGCKCRWVGRGVWVKLYHNCDSTMSVSRVADIVNDVIEVVSYSCRSRIERKS